MCILTCLDKGKFSAIIYKVRFKELVGTYYLLEADDVHTHLLKQGEILCDNFPLSGGVNSH